MPIINWNKAFSVENEEIDSQHKKLINLINKLHDAIMERKSREVMQEILTELVNYTHTHFSTEENYFAKINYANSANHQAEHKLFTDKVQNFQDEYAKGKALLSIEIIDFLKDWLIKHIMGVDKQYIPAFKEAGLS